MKICLKICLIDKYNYRKEGIKMKKFICEYCNNPVIKYPDKVLKCTNCGHTYNEEWGIEHRKIVPYTRSASAFYVGGNRRASELLDEGNRLIDTNPVRAAYYFEESAKLGNAVAARMLGKMKLLGQGIPKDATSAAKYFNMSIDHQESIFYLAAMTYNGDGVTKDLSKAATLYKKSADMGNVRAAHYFATMCERGQGVPKDIKKAVEYYEKSVSDPESAFYLAQLKFNGMDDNCNDEDVVILLSGISDIPQAAFLLGICFNEGRGTKQNKEIAKQLFKFVASNNLEYTKDYIRKTGLL